MLTGRGMHADREPYYTNGLHSDDQCLICRDYEERENGRENKRDKKEAIKLRNKIQTQKGSNERLLILKGTHR